MEEQSNYLVDNLYKFLVSVISETNGITLHDTLELLLQDLDHHDKPRVKNAVEEFYQLLMLYHQEKVEMDTLLNHPFSAAMFKFFKNFPLPFQEDHIHLTGSLTADFIYPQLKELLEGENKDIYKQKIDEVYGEGGSLINSIEDVDQRIRLGENDLFERYLEILLLPKLILTTRERHEQASYHMAKTLYEEYNVGLLRLKFTLSRETQNTKEQIPGLENLTKEDVVLGLYSGFKQYQRENPLFKFTLSPSFRKETHYFDQSNYKSKEEHFLAQVGFLLDLIEKYPELEPHLNEVDTVGNEKDFFRKSHFYSMHKGFRKLQYNGFKVRSHHGETWHTLKNGVQAVDNSINIWHINTLEHGLSLGINPNYYFHSLYQRIRRWNSLGRSIKQGSSEYKELCQMDWSGREDVLNKILGGESLTEKEHTHFVKTKFHTAREIEHYQHDVLNRMINRGVSLTALPSSNKRLTTFFPDHKDHPFSWWEKKGVKLGVGTDNYITLCTNYIKEMLIVLYSDYESLKLTKLLMVTTGETRRPYISSLYWKMRKDP